MSKITTMMAAMFAAAGQYRAEEFRELKVSLGKPTPSKNTAFTKGKRHKSQRSRANRRKK